MIIFNGKQKARIILLGLKKRLERERIRPKLAVVEAGKNPASELFIKNKNKAAQEIGIEVVVFKFKNSAGERQIIQKIHILNNDTSVAGIIVQLPLPPKLDSSKIVGAIDPGKDVDGFGSKAKFASPLVSAIQIALKTATQDVKKKKILAIVNSDIFGETLKKSLDKKTISINYFIRKKSSAEELKAGLKRSDIILSVCGCPNFIKGDMIKKGAILIDAGITTLTNGKVAGDIDAKSVSLKAFFLTPVPGGIGPLTVALLLKNVYFAAKQYVK